ncbi:hypothetical protein [Specibacter cremeus]|uniref:hypothetical protein n=1 Tax=Specibacter cremeus TaxID=1629051 RepID=UPI000F7675ED|nr:hypothetical protein [Specibacter cremeus]
MSARARWTWLIAITVVALAAATGYGVWSFIGYQQRQSAPAAVALDTAGTGLSGPHVVFRNTAAGAGYGHVAEVPVADPGGPRTVTDAVCDRVYSAGGTQACLRTNAGIVTTFEAAVYDSQWRQEKSWPLPGIPSRTRVSTDGKLVASTAFVTGHAYAPTSFSTATVISKVAGGDYGNLEDFTLIVDGHRLAPADRNFWGVTFGNDDNTFYATAAAGTRTWLVKGDLRARTLTSVHETAECPSLSPDGRRIAYKKNVTPGPVPHWNIAVLDLATNKETVLAETRSVDDQVEWLNDSTLLYGLPREGAVGDDDVWSIGTRAGDAPSLFIAHAWSPSVVR